MKWLGPIGGGPASGKLGSVVASRNRGGQYLRQLAIPVDPNTPRQQASKGAMGTSNSIWKNVLTFDQRAGWDAYAQLTPLPDSLGDPRNVGGKAMFARGVNARLSVGVGLPLVTAPATPGVAQDAQFLVTGDTTDGVEVTLLTPSLVIGDLVFVRISPAVNQTKNQFSSPYTFIVAITNTTTFPLQLIEGVNVAVGQRYFVAMRTFTFDSRASFLTQLPVDILV